MDQTGGQAGVHGCGEVNKRQACLRIIIHFFSLMQQIEAQNGRERKKEVANVTAVTLKHLFSWWYWWGSLADENLTMNTLSNDCIFNFKLYIYRFDPLKTSQNTNTKRNTLYCFAHTVINPKKELSCEFLWERDFHKGKMMNKEFKKAFFLSFWISLEKREVRKTRPDTRLPQSRAGGQGQYLSY